MYTDYFQLREIPFSITPDPAYLYLSPRHQEALGHLLYGTGQYGGFVQLTGEVGTGKTTVIRTLLAQKLPEVDVAMIHNPRQNEREFVQSLCDELGIGYEDGNHEHAPTLKQLVDALNRHLLSTHAAGRRTVLIIDEAQNLQPGVLEQVRLLTNLETHKEKLLRIMLVGQPELADLLARPDLRQLAQRITARYHLTPLDERETVEYIQHRLRVAGGGAGIFDDRALSLVHGYSRGVPRLINVICDRAMLAAYASGARLITPALVREAAHEAVGGLDQPATPAPGRLTRFWVKTEKLWAPLAAVLACLLLYQNLRLALPVASTPDSVAMPAAPSPPAAVPPIAPPAAAPDAAVTPTAPAAAADATAAAPAPAVEADRRAQLLQSAQPLPVVMGRLIRLWDGRLRLADGQNVCRELHDKLKLECYKSRGKWADLRQMNRPALLTLRDGSGEERHVLLRGIGAEQATLETATGEQNYPLSLLDTLWTGEFLLLWRSESGVAYIGPEVRGQPVFWLTGRLTQLGLLKPQTSINDRYEATRRAALPTFQTARGLDADGIAGIRTLIALGDVEPDTPMLGVAP